MHCLTHASFEFYFALECSAKLSAQPHSTQPPARRSPHNTAHASFKSLRRPYALAIARAPPVISSSPGSDQRRSSTTTAQRSVQHCNGSTGTAAIASPRRSSHCRSDSTRLLQVAASCCCNHSLFLCVLAAAPTASRTGKRSTPKTSAAAAAESPGTQIISARAFGAAEAAGMICRPTLAARVHFPADEEMFDRSCLGSTCQQGSRTNKGTPHAAAVRRSTRGW